jgi:predicted Zn-dependent protease
MTGEAPTGHGFRGNALRRTMLRPVTPVLNAAALRAEPGNTASLADLMAGMSNGLLIESLLGGQQRTGLSPVVEGRIRLGFTIRDGRVTGMLRSAPLSLDLRTVLGAQFMAATEQHWAVSRIWSGRLPFVLASADGSGAADV